MTSSPKNKIHTMPFKEQRTETTAEDSRIHHVGSGTGKSDFKTKDDYSGLPMEAPNGKSASTEIERLEKMLGLVGRKFGKGEIVKGLPFITDVNAE